MNGIEFTYLRIIFILFICVRSYSLDIFSFQLCSTMNPDCSICMNFCDAPWLFAVWAFCIAEDTILSHHNLIVNLVIIINLNVLFLCAVLRSVWRCL